MAPHAIDVLDSTRCPHVADAEREIAGVTADVRQLDVALAGRGRDFTGGPTVRVDGRDVQPDAVFHDGPCRHWAGGLTLPYPPADLVLRAPGASGGASALP